jgi:hypothetical protein
MHIELPFSWMRDLHPIQRSLLRIGLAIAVFTGGCGPRSGTSSDATKELPDFAKKMQETMKAKAAAQKGAMKKRG